MTDELCRDRDCIEQGMCTSPDDCIMKKDSNILRDRIKSILSKKIKEGKNIFAGTFYGFDAQNVQLSCSNYDDGVTVMYCCYGKMYNLLYTHDELGIVK